MSAGQENGARSGDAPARWSRVSLLTIFLLVLVPLATLVLGGSAWYTRRMESREKIAELRKSLDDSAGQLAAGLALPVWYLDQQQMALILDHAMDNPAVQLVSIQLETADWEILMRYRGPDGRILASTDPAVLADAPPRPGTIETERPIRFGGHPLGKLRLVFTTHMALAELSQSLWKNLVSLVFLDLALVAGVSLLLWRLVLRPLHELQELAGVVGSGAEADLVPARNVFRGELGDLRRHLAQGFELLRERYASLRASEEALRAKTALLEAQMHATIDGILVVSPDRKPILMNRRFAELFDLPADLAAGGDQAPLLQHSTGKVRSPERFLARLQYLYRHPDEVGREELELVNGRVLDRYSAPVVGRGGQYYGRLWIFRDITESRQAELERSRLQAQLLQAQKMESLGSLAGGISHDMNNVLAAILGLATASVESQPPGSSARRAFDTIAQAAQRGGKLVQGLLNFARRTPAEERQLDLNALLREEAGLLEHTTLSKIRLVLDLAEDLHPVQGDGAALSHAFMNLCVNAVDAMPENGTLTLRSRNLEDGWVEVRVEDTGTGMPAETLAKAMDPFFTTKMPGKGTGLGLSMVYSTVKAHRGRMELQSRIGRGTQVQLLFPPAGPDEAAPEPAPGRAGAGLQRPLEVLLVDDDELVQSSSRLVLEMLGHRVATAGCGEEALAMLGTGLAPDVVILDMNMPGLGGGGTLPRLRALRPALPVLLATGRVDQKALDLAERHRFVKLLPKPFALQDLKETLAGILPGA